MDIFKEFTFEAAHKLNLPFQHKCNRLHGHSYRVEIHLYGKVNGLGWVVDFAEIKEAFAPLMEQLDHSYLNDIPGLENPTAENLAGWIWARFQPPRITILQKVVVRETCTSGVEYYGTP